MKGILLYESNRWIVEQHYEPGRVYKYRLHPESESMVSNASLVSPFNRWEVVFEVIDCCAKIISKI